jgi:hypothetical protein
MITIPTGELVKVLAGALAFAPVVKTDELRGVLIEWNGEGTLHVSGYDVLSGACVSWWDGAGQESDERADDDLVVHYGGDDAPWRAFVAYDDVTDLLKTFRLPAKLWWVPVNLKINPMGSRLIVERSPEFGKPEASMAVRVDRGVTVKFPDIRGITDLVLAGSRSLRDVVQFAPHRLGAYGAVQVGDVMELTFGVEGYPTVVQMGPRVVGFAHPVGAQRSATRVRQEFNALRDGVGVHVSGAPRAVPAEDGVAGSEPETSTTAPIHHYDDPGAA